MNQCVHESDVHLDLECLIDDRVEVVCSLYMGVHFPIRPLVGEKITFPSDGAGTRFNVVMKGGYMPAVDFVCVEIDEISHHVKRGEYGPVVGTHVQCVALRVPSLADARQAAELLCKHGFDVNPYGINKL